MDSVVSGVVVGALSGFVLVTVESLLLWVLVLLFEVVFDAVSGGYSHCCWCSDGGDGRDGRGGEGKGVGSMLVEGSSRRRKGGLGF